MAESTGYGGLDQDGYVLDEIVQDHRNTKAAKRLLTRLLKKQGTAPKRTITDKLRSYGAPGVSSWATSNIGHTKG